MMINWNDKIMSCDNMLCGFTIQELIDTANANGDSIQDTFNLMLSECVENAKDMLELYGKDIERVRKEG